jgi:hypothetical protein
VGFADRVAAEQFPHGKHRPVRRRHGGRSHIRAAPNTTRKEARLEDPRAQRVKVPSRILSIARFASVDFLYTVWLAARFGRLSQNLYLSMSSA